MRKRAHEHAARDDPSNADEATHADTLRETMISELHKMGRSAETGATTAVKLAQAAHVPTGVLMSELNFSQKARYWFVHTPGTIVMQPTSLCPLACTYCYLPQKHLKQEMSPSTARAVASKIPPGWAARKPVEIVWHGGETLTIGRAKLGQLLDQFEPLRLAGHTLNKGADQRDTDYQ